MFLYTYVQTYLYMYVKTERTCKHQIKSERNIH